MKSLLFALVAVLALTTPAAAEKYNPRQLAKVEEIHVRLIDTVVGGCLPKPGVLKTEAESILRQSGIKIARTMHERAHVLTITVAIHFNGGVCVAAMATELFRVEALADLSLGRVEASTVLGVHSGKKKGFQEHLRLTVNERVQRLAVEILKALVNTSSVSQ